MQRQKWKNGVEKKDGIGKRKISHEVKQYKRIWIANCNMRVQLHVVSDFRHYYFEIVLFILHNNNKIKKN
jgi:hypothetical protein